MKEANCICPRCGALLYVKFSLCKDVECPNCGRVFNPLFGDGKLIGQIKK